MSRLTFVVVVLVIAVPVPGLAGVVKGPYLQDARTDRVTVACETDAAASCVVNWGDGLSNAAGLVANGNHHEGVIDGLDPSTCYDYQLGCDGETSPQSSFCTAPPAGEPFSFVLFGDTRSGHADHQALIDRIITEGVDFYINTGDLVASGEVEEDWEYFFDIEGELLRNTPLFPVVGNHDEDDGNLDVYERLLAPPTESSGRESYYSFTYGNAHFIAIDNQASATWAWNLDTTQKNWALAEMDAAAANPDIDHIFVLLHENMYSSKDGRSGDWVLRGMRDDMKSKGVDYVFAGHDHYYERGMADNGLPYIISGGGGAGLYDTENPTEGDPVNVTFPAHTVIYSKKVHHYIRIDIHGPWFNACTKDSSGVILECFSYGEQPEDGGVDAGPDGFDGGIDGGDDGDADAGLDGGIDGGADEGQPADENPCAACVDEPYDPVCGEDGVTYDNLCLLDCHEMGMEHMGPCEEDPCDLCPDTYQPVCGKDGKTYDNQCLMECVGVEGAHEGPCEGPQDCSECPDINQPVCGKDGKTYKNQCLMECMGIEGAHPGPCESGGSSCGCTTSRRPFAASLPILLFVVLAWRRSRRA